MKIDPSQTSALAEIPGFNRADMPSEGKGAQSERTREPRDQQGGSASPELAKLPSATTVVYSVDEKTKQVCFQVVDAQSGEVLRQVPPSEILNAERQISDYLNALDASRKKKA